MSDDTVSAAATLAGEATPAPASEGDTGNATSFLDAFTEDHRGFIENKGWGDHDAVVNGYRNLEKLVGANTVGIPKEDDQDGWTSLYGKLGRPEAPSDYSLEANEQSDEAMTQWFKDTAHKVGLSQKQAAYLMTEWDAMAGGLKEGSSNERNLASETDIASLRSDLGLGYDAFIQSGKRAAAQFGGDEATLSKIEDAIGTKATLEMFASIGKGMGEHAFESGEESAGFGLSPAAAKNQIGDLKLDKQFQEAYLDSRHPGHKEAVEKMQRLMKHAHPEV